MERPRSKFDRSHQLLTTINEGELVPIYCDEVIPGDTAKVQLNGLIRMSTPIYPIMDNCYMDTYFFFVPCRLLWEHWENMFGENDTNYWAERFEYSTPTCKIGGKSGLLNGSIGDYFGNIFVRSPNMGETASPGNEVNAEIDQMAIKVIRGIVPRPVCIFIMLIR